MVVRIQKPVVNLREKLAELERPIGLKGSELMRAETVQDARDFVSAGRKNLIINGGMDVWQRGTSFLDPASASYTADRWKNSSNNTDITRSTDVPSGQLFTYSMLMAANGSGGTRHAALQGVELPATGSAGLFKSGTTWTFSCWLKGGANGSILFGADFRDDPNSGTNAVSLTSTTFYYTTSWQKFTHTFTIGASPGGTNLCLAIILFNATAPTHSLNITGCQLEVGKNSTEFEHRSYGEELALCQRYFWRTDTDNIYSQVANGMYTTNNIVKCVVQYPVPMRIVPTVSVSSGQSNTFYAQQGDTALTVSGATFSSQWTAGSGVLKSWLDFNNIPNGTQGYAVAIYRANGNGGLSFNAEL